MKKSTSEKESLRVLYTTSAIILLIAVSISFFMIRVENILTVWWSLAGIFSGGMLGLFLLGFFSKKAGNVPALIGVALGLLVIMWMSLSPYLTEKLKSPFHNYLTIVFGTMTIFFAGFLISFMANRYKLKGKII